MKTLLIDDMRILPNVTRTAKTYQDGIDALCNEGPWNLLLLDHDLGCFDEYGREWTGYDVMCFLENNPHYLPEKIKCVSGNSVGRAKIIQVIEKLGMKHE